jgi:hypothetical protein
LFSGFNKVSTVPAGSFAKAAFVGAKTVKGPALCKVATKSAAFTAATNVVWSFDPTAISTIVYCAFALTNMVAIAKRVRASVLIFIFIVFMFNMK